MIRRITLNTTIGELLELEPEIGNFFRDIGMHCIGCASSRHETIEEAANVHLLDPEDLLEDIKGFMQV